MGWWNSARWWRKEGMEWSEVRGPDILCKTTPNRPVRSSPPHHSILGIIKWTSCHLSPPVYIGTYIPVYVHIYIHMYLLLWICTGKPLAKLFLWCMYCVHVRSTLPISMYSTWHGMAWHGMVWWIFTCVLIDQCWIYIYVSTLHVLYVVGMYGPSQDPHPQRLWLLPLRQRRFCSRPLRQRLFSSPLFLTPP